MMNQDRELTQPRVQELSRSQKHNKGTYREVMDMFNQVTRLVNGTLLDKRQKPVPYISCKINSQNIKVYCNSHSKALSFFLVKGKKETEIEVNLHLKDITLALAKDIELDIQKLDALMEEVLAEGESHKQVQEERDRLLKEVAEFSTDYEELRLKFETLEASTSLPSSQIPQVLNKLNEDLTTEQAINLRLKRFSFVAATLLIGIVYSYSEGLILIG